MTNHKSISDTLLLALAGIVLALSLALGGWFIRDGLQTLNRADRTVSVKGLAEQNVEADLAVWSITHSVTGNELAVVQADIEKNGTILRSFLATVGFSAAEVLVGPVQAQDLLAQSYRPEGVEKGRYIITQEVIIRTNDFTKLDKALAGLGTLAGQGVVLTNPQMPAYIYTKLNSIKPGMLAEATRNGRDAASEFATQSGAKVGDIKRASQGVFQILPRDAVNGNGEQSQRFKTVRVVSTIDFYLQ